MAFARPQAQHADENAAENREGKHGQAGRGLQAQGNQRRYGLRTGQWLAAQAPSGLLTTLSLPKIVDTASDGTGLWETSGTLSAPTIQDGPPLRKMLRSSGQRTSVKDR